MTDKTRPSPLRPVARKAIVARVLASGDEVVNLPVAAFNSSI